jgi:hypothetical protein
MIQLSSLGRGGRTFSSVNRPLNFWDAKKPHIQWAQEYFPGLKRQGCEVDHSPKQVARLMTALIFLLSLYPFIKLTGTTLSLTFT